MQSAPELPSESDRLRDLALYDLVEDGDDLGMSEIANLAARLFDVPIALVSIVQKDKQFFKVRTGIDVCTTERSVSFCAHALGLDDIMEVPDTLQDFRFASNPLVTGSPGIRFYAGVPLRTPNGNVLGTFCIIDTRPRNSLSTQEKANLRCLGGLILDKLESRRLAVAHSAGQSRFENIAETSPDGVVCADGFGHITFWNRSCEKLFGYDRASALGANLDIIVPPRMRGIHGGGLKRVAGGGEPRLLGKTVELDAMHQDGTEFPVELSLSMWKEAGRSCFGAIIRDIRVRRADEKRMFDLAFVDRLSGLPNRAVLMTRITELKAIQEPFAVMMLDLDAFKDVNDTLGHHIGDAVLREIANRLSKCISAIDTLARLGGDEFAVLIPSNEDGTVIRKNAEHMLTAVAAPIYVDGHEIHVKGSIGVAFFPEHSSKAGDTLSAADLALYRAKGDGGNCMRIYTPNLRHAVEDRRTSESDIRRATERQEFELFYQPQVRASDGALLGVEALLRWRHPVEGLLAPGRFLAALESGPFAVKVGRWVMETACFHAQALRRFVPDLMIGVNLFGAQFHTGKLAQDVLNVLNLTGLPPNALELEITESIILRHDDLNLAPLRDLRNMGVGIAFDDFGTGYASLSLLKRYPLTRLKIDRSFIESICSDRADAAIVNAVIAMASSLDLNIIAEGVETAEQRDFLLISRCDAIQGYFYGKPMSVSDLQVFIEKSALHQGSRLNS